MDDNDEDNDDRHDANERSPTEKHTTTAATVTANHKNKSNNENTTDDSNEKIDAATLGLGLSSSSSLLLSNYHSTTPGAVAVAGSGTPSVVDVSGGSTRMTPEGQPQEIKTGPSIAHIEPEQSTAAPTVAAGAGNGSLNPSNDDDDNNNNNASSGGADDGVGGENVSVDNASAEDEGFRPTASTAPPIMNTSLPVAEEYQDLPLLEAVRVPPVVTTLATAVVFHVDIDGEADGDLEQQPRQVSAQQTKSLHCVTLNKRKWLLPLFAMIAAIAIIVVVVEVLVGKNGENSEEEGYPYLCFTSTLQIIEAQILAPKTVPMMTPLVICPNTRIHIGTFRNPSRNDFNMTGGDYTITVLRENVTIQCGLDGKRSNNCTLDGGLAHVVTQDRSYHPKYGNIKPTPSIDGFTMRGVTFTGQIQGAGVFGGLSIALSHPGKGIRFEDCAWVNLTATKRLITVGTNYLMELVGNSVPDLSVELTLSNCFLDNVIYEEELLLSKQQSFRIENTTFRNVKLTSLLSAGCAIHPNGCRNLLHCPVGGPSRCSISNVCVENMDTTGAAPIVISNETEWTSSGTNLWYGTAEFIRDSNDTLIAGLSPSAEGVFGNNYSLPFCDLGVAVMVEDSEDANYTCLDPPVFQPGTSDAGCPITIWP